jgi:integrase
MSVANYRRVFKRALADLNGLADADKRLSHLDPHGPHALRATYATWLEDAGIPSRVIDELMGHESGRQGGEVSRMGALYRETTPEMLARVTAAIDERLSLALAAAAPLLREMDELRRKRLPRGKPRRKAQAV